MDWDRTRALARKIETPRHDRDQGIMVVERPLAWRQATGEIRIDAPPKTLDVFGADSSLPSRALCCPALTGHRAVLAGGPEQGSTREFLSTVFRNYGVCNTAVQVSCQISQHAAVRH